MRNLIIWDTIVSIDFLELALYSITFTACLGLKLWSPALGRRASKQPFASNHFRRLQLVACVP